MPFFRFSSFGLRPCARFVSIHGIVTLGSLVAAATSFSTARADGKETAPEAGTAGAEIKKAGVYAGAGFIPRFAYHGGAFYRVLPDVAAEGEIAHGSYSLKFGGNGVESKRTHATLRGRYFVGSSFNLNAGLAYDILTDSSQYDESTAAGATTRVELESTVHQIEFELGLGNRWTMGSFLIGCDWIGIGLPLVQTSVSTKANDGAKAIGEKDDFESDAKARAKALSPHFLRLHLGYAF